MMNSARILLERICHLTETYKRIELAKGEGYNLFRVIDMTSNETSIHSAFLADLLSPTGMHGMGDIFLKLFVEQINQEIDFKTETAHVEREKYIGIVKKNTGGRLDILVEDSSGNSIIIENKIYASDQKNQMIRYYNYAQNRYHDSGNYILLYLSLDGEIHNEAKTASTLIRNKHYYTISYEKDIIEWLERCREKATNKPLIREGISHYINLIKYLTHQTLNKEMETEMQNLILSNPNYIRSIRVIKDAIELAEINLQEKFWRELKRQMDEAGYNVAPEPLGYSNYYDALKGDRIRNYYRKSKECHYGFEFMIGKYMESNIYYAIRKHNPLICGILARKNESSQDCTDGKERKPITKYEDFLALQTFCEQLGYNRDDSGWYIGYKDVKPRLNFKELDENTLELLINTEHTVKVVVEEAITDIENIRTEISKPPR